MGLLIKFFIIDFHFIEGTSMSPSIKPGSFVAEYKLAYGLVKPFTSYFFIHWKNPKPGDVVLYVQNNHTVIKRCVAVEHDRLVISYDSGYILSVHDKIIPLTETQYSKLKNASKVPEGMILAIGDNYEESIDSREYGFVSIANVLGKALCK